MFFFLSLFGKFVWIICVRLAEYLLTTCKNNSNNHCFSFFLLDAFAKLDTLEKIVNQNIFRVHHHHAKMVELAVKPAITHMNANVHQVSFITFSLPTFEFERNRLTPLNRWRLIDKINKNRIQKSFFFSEWQFDCLKLKFVNYIASDAKRFWLRKRNLIKSFEIRG